jgi:CBS domain containing-hemolysin-like protein
MVKKDYSHVLVYKSSKDEIVGVIKVKEFAVKYLRCENKNIKA